DEEDVDDDIEGWVDEMEMMDADKHADLMQSLHPVKVMLVKLRKIAFKMVHSSMILLLAWKLLLQEQKRTIRIMPHDVVTRWNSMFDMLQFAIEYRPALEEMT
ncbi:hypothetical protein BDR06DRAFT_833422, partial [Suillus hirtellus]